MIYELTINDGDCTLIDGKSVFKNRLKNKTPKYAIYMFRKNDEIIYIGQTERGIYRCIDGLTCNENQSASYPWRTHRDIRNSKLQLLVVSVGLPNTMAIRKAAREVVEADVACAVYRANSDWPVKLTAIKVHGGTVRTKSYRKALSGIVNRLEKENWLICT